MSFLDINISILKIFEQLRNPFFDSLFSLLSILIEEYSSFAFVVVIYWCIDRKKGNYLLVMLFVGMVINQTLKLMFMVPRPWVYDSSLTIVESAREMAFGYSFPSGHTQTSITSYGGIGYLSKNKFIKWGFYILSLLIALSRMYLGVHYPIDVLVSLLIGIVLIPLFLNMYTKENHKKTTIIWCACLVICVFFLIYTRIRYNEALLANYDAEEFYNYSSTLSIAYKLLGMLLGISVNSLMNTKYTDFEEKAPLLIQILKVVLGCAICFAIRGCTKTILNSVFGLFGETIRYFLIVFFSTMWPVIFNKLISKYFLGNL